MLKDFKSKRKLENDVEADLADCSPTKAQRIWFHLETEPSIQEAFSAFTSSPNFGDMAEEANGEASEEARLQMAMNLMARLRSLLIQDQLLVRLCLILSQYNSKVSK